MRVTPLAVLMMMMACCNVVVHVSAFRSRLPTVTKIGSSSSSSSFGSRPHSITVQLSTAGIIEVRKPTESEVTRCQRWSTWGCGVSKFPWTYSDQETAYIISGTFYSNLVVMLTVTAECDSCESPSILWWIQHIQERLKSLPPMVSQCSSSRGTWSSSPPACHAPGMCWRTWRSTTPSTDGWMDGYAAVVVT